MPQGQIRERNRWAKIHKAKRAAKKRKKARSSGYHFAKPCCPKCEKEWRQRMAQLGLLADAA